MSDFTPLLKAAVSGKPLPSEAMAEAMAALLDGAVSDVEAAAFLGALAARGETIEEISVAAEVMRSKALRVAAPADGVDTCGTGGDGQGTFNVSTAAALITAGAGAPVAKHGNKAASSKSGSSDVLAALGVNLQATPAQIERCIRDAGVGFLFAALHHKAVANVARVRSQLGVRTLFNILGPLTNPAGARRQVMGVFSAHLVEPIAQALAALGASHAWVVHGEDGLDEISTTGATHISEVKNGAVSSFRVHPSEVGLSVASMDDLRGGDPNENAEAMRQLLNGAPGPYRDIAVLNAGAAIMVGGKAKTLQQGVDLAQSSIDSGSAKRALSDLVRLSNTDANDAGARNERAAR